MRGSAEYSATWGHTSVAGDMHVSRRARAARREIKVAPRITRLFVLDSEHLSWAFCFARTPPEKEESK